jgi:hypothetical protein
LKRRDHAGRDRGLAIFRGVTAAASLKLHVLHLLLLRRLLSSRGVTTAASLKHRCPMRVSHRSARQQSKFRRQTSEPRNHRQMHAVALGDRRKRFARGTALDRFGSLVVAQCAYGRI